MHAIRRTAVLLLIVALATGLAQPVRSETVVTDDQNYQGAYEIRNAEKIGIGVSGTPSVELYNNGDFITRGPYVDVRSYASFSVALAAIGSSTEKTLLIPNTQNVTTDEDVPPKVTLWFTTDGKLNVSSGKKVTICGDVQAGLYTIFQGSGQVVFKGGGITTIYPEWWGARADSSTSGSTNHDAIAKAVASLSENTYPGNITFQTGYYKIAGDPGIYFNIPVIVNGGGATFDYDSQTTGVAVQCGGAGGDNSTVVADSTFRDFSVIHGGTGATGILVQNLQRSHFYNLYVGVASGGTGLKLYGNRQGCSYNDFYGVIVNLSTAGTTGILMDCYANVNSYVSAARFYGGSVVGGDHTQGTAAGIEITYTATARIIDGCAFYGTIVEPDATRKLKDAGHGNAYHDIYWDASVSATDIEFTSTSANCILHGGNGAGLQHITDSGTNNLIQFPAHSMPANFTFTLLSPTAHYYHIGYAPYDLKVKGMRVVVHGSAGAHVDLSLVNDDGAGAGVLDMTSSTQCNVGGTSPTLTAPGLGASRGLGVDITHVNGTVEYMTVTVWCD